MSSNKQLIKTISISGIAVLIGYLTNYFLTAYITENVGIEAYGFVSIAKTLVSYVQILTVALTSFTVRFIAVAYHKNDITEAKEFFSSSISAGFVLSSFIIIVFTPIIWNLQLFLKIPSEIINAVKLLFALVLFNFIIQTVMTPYGSVAIVKNRLDIAGVIKILSYTVDACTLIIMFKNLHPAVWFVGIGSISASIVNVIGNVFLTKKFIPELKYSVRLTSFSRIKMLLKNGIYNSINQMGNVLNSGLDLIISNLLLSHIATGQISVAKTVLIIFSSLSLTIYQPMEPKLIEVYATGNMDNFKKEMKKSIRICGGFTNIAVAGFFALGLLYYKLWLPSQDSVRLYWLTLVSIFMYLTAGMVKPIYFIDTLTLKNKLPCVITVASGILNIFSMYMLIKYTSLGAYAVVGTTTVIMMCINFFFNPMHSAKAIDISPKFFYKIIFRHLFSAAVMMGVFSFISWLLNPTGWMGLFASAALMCICGVIIHVAVMCNIKEIKEIIFKIKGKIIKNSK